MARYDPERMERSTRDVVSRAGYTEIMAGRGTPDGGVMIDISHLGRAEVEQRFAGMVARTRQIGQDLATGPVKVSPTAHFHMGGAIIDRDCRTGLDGLLVAGEDAGGVHGANRLGGNGVAESTVYGARAGDTAAAIARERSLREPDPAQVRASAERALAPLRREGDQLPFELTRELKDAMWEGAGVVRDRAGLEQARERLADLGERLAAVAVPGGTAANQAWQETLDLANQLTVARVIVASALAREESRGAHYRADHPEQDDARWLRVAVARRGDDDAIELGWQPVDFTRARPAVAEAAP